MEPGDERARQALRESEERYRIVTEISRDAVEVVNEAGEIIFVNPAVEEVWGKTPRECLGKKMRDELDVVHPDDHERVAREYERVAKEGETVHYAPMRCRHNDGSWRWIKAIATSYVSAGGERCMLEVTQDITEQVEAEQRKQQIVEQVKESQRLESLGVLAGGIAHDFNNILVAVLGCSDLALHKLSPLSPVRPLIEKIMTGGQRAADLCSQMLAYAGKRPLSIDAVDLNQVVEEISQLMEASVSKKAVFEYAFAENLPAVEADGAQLTQVILNLIVNASEAIGEKNGVIRVCTGAMWCDREALEQAFFFGEDLAEGVYVYCEVSDTGCGIDAETKEKIFDPFFTTKFTGRGLGLATVLGIARAHKGAIGLSSEPGKGTVIKVFLPAMQQSATLSAKEAPPLEDWRGSGTILLVDDEDLVLDVAQTMLERVGFRVLTARDGHEAMAIYRQRQDEIVCVILDLMMPNLGGEETLGELRRIREDVKVVLSSGYQERDVTERVVDMGFEGFVQKPYTTEALIGQVRQALAGTLLRR